MDDLLDDAEAETAAGAGLLPARAGEALEDPAAVRGGHAGPVVRHPDVDHVAAVGDRDAGEAVAVEVGVAEEVGEGSQQLDPVDEQGGVRAVGRLGRDQVGRVAGRPQRLVDQLPGADRHAFPLGGVAGVELAERQQVLQGPVEAGELVGHEAHRLLRPR
ncbi:hypothetical protein [Nocardioides sp. TF02-7]|uniref:hypothetical protein n=1 Tax=Nocardioides sp. TF02-7 TaxID=2917724 RepID=UPI001F053A63|nr:hypothetical protein [Nocardioides sp. TF02-7]UMG91833.1 hypothetical protein MF408_17555 [Nocardioides sp. TF02-7]